MDCHSRQNTVESPDIGKLVFLLLAFISIPLVLGESNWPGWRGPRGDGSSLDMNAPLKWNLELNLVWKNKIPGRGHASPIVWQNSVFIVTAIEESRERILLCIDRETGKTVWRETILTSPLEEMHWRNSYASSTPVTDGNRIYVTFLDKDRMYVAAYDFEGRKVWEKRPGPFSSIHGYSSNPVLWKDTVIINGDHDGDSYIISLKKDTGETVWKIDRPNRTRSYCTPIIRNIDGRDQLMLSGNMCVASYDPDSGSRQWIMDGPTEQFVASMVYNGTYLFMTCGWPERFMLGIDPRGSGNVTNTHEVWRVFRDASYVPSPVAIDNFFLVVSDKGKASCIDGASGEVYWNEKIGREHGASSVSLQGHACFISDTGDMTVIKPGKSIEIVATNKLNEQVQASPAIANGQWFIRGSEHLYCIGQKR